MPILPPCLLKDPAEIALLHWYPLSIWSPTLAPNRYTTLSLQAPRPMKYLRMHPQPCAIPAGLIITNRYKTKLQKSKQGRLAGKGDQDQRQSRN